MILIALLLSYATAASDRGGGGSSFRPRSLRRDPNIIRPSKISPPRTPTLPASLEILPPSQMKEPLPATNPPKDPSEFAEIAPEYFPIDEPGDGGGGGIDPGVPCSCSPRSFDITLDFSGDCGVDTLVFNGGIADTACLVFDEQGSPLPWPDYANEAPSEIDSMVFVEWDRNDVVINYDGNVQPDNGGGLILGSVQGFLDGSSVHLPSISASLDPNVHIKDQLQLLPAAAALVMVGRDSTGTDAVFYLGWEYDDAYCDSNDSSDTAYTSSDSGGERWTVEEGDELAWVVFGEAGGPLEEFCPRIAEPTLEPTCNPTPKPTPEPTSRPTSNPTMHPTKVPTESPSKPPTSSPTMGPTASPTPNPSEAPTIPPSEAPTPNPSMSPTHIPTMGPTMSPTSDPSEAPTPSPSKDPTKSPSKSPSHSPTMGPTTSPTPGPSKTPTSSPSKAPTESPSKPPSHSPTLGPTTSPTSVPSQAPTLPPSKAPALNPSESPSHGPTLGPTATPTSSPSKAPTLLPSKAPTPPPTDNPTFSPTPEPTHEPTPEPTPDPTPLPTDGPTVAPTLPPINFILPGLINAGNNGIPSDAFPLGACEGDCDSDIDCQGDLVCFMRDGMEGVPGCEGLGIPKYDYCAIRPPNYLAYRAESNRPLSAFPLGSCEGDCDFDAQCAEGLVCFNRKRFEPVPGCVGVGMSGKDYCIEEFRLVDVGYDAARPLGLCEGDCDDDDDCGEGLTCYQRQYYDAVPGCAGSGTKNDDYCIKELI